MVSAVASASSSSLSLFEIQSAELALRRSKEAFVLDYAKQLLTDHRKAQAELEAAAKSQPAEHLPLQIKARLHPRLTENSHGSADVYLLIQKKQVRY